MPSRSEFVTSKLSVAPRPQPGRAFSISTRCLPFAPANAQLRSVENAVLQGVPCALSLWMHPLFPLSEAKVDTSAAKLTKVTLSGPARLRAKRAARSNWSTSQGRGECEHS